LIGASNYLTILKQMENPLDIQIITKKEYQNAPITVESFPKKKVTFEDFQKEVHIYSKNF
jgi:hypothetical protein